MSRWPGLGGCDDAVGLVGRSMAAVAVDALADGNVARKASGGGGEPSVRVIAEGLYRYLRTSSLEKAATGAGDKGCFLVSELAGR